MLRSSAKNHFNFVLSPCAVSKAKINGNSELYIKSGSDINLTCIVLQTPEPPSFIYWWVWAFSLDDSADWICSTCISTSFREIQIYSDLHSIESVLSKNFDGRTSVKTNLRWSESSLELVFGGAVRVFRFHRSCVRADSEILLCFLFAYKYLHLYIQFPSRILSNNLKIRSFFLKWILSYSITY